MRRLDQRILWNFVGNQLFEQSLYWKLLWIVDLGGLDQGGQVRLQLYYTNIWQH